jgi:hypothetical protein
MAFFDPWTISCEFFKFEEDTPLNSASGKYEITGEDLRISHSKKIFKIFE